MTPPNGAWMTRDGDVIEIGCHSGSKTWRLECRDGQWMGSVGFCGRGNVGKAEDVETNRPAAEGKEPRSQRFIG